MITQHRYRIYVYIYQALKHAFFRFCGTYLSPLFIGMDKVWIFKGCRGHHLSLYYLWQWEPERTSSVLVSKDVIFKNWHLPFIYPPALGTIPLKRLGHLCLRSIIWDTYGIGLYTWGSSYLETIANKYCNGE